MNPLSSIVEGLASDEVTAYPQLQGNMQGHVITSSASPSSTSPGSSPIPKRLDMTSFKSIGDVFVGGIKRNTSLLNQSTSSLLQPHSAKSVPITRMTASPKEVVRKFSVPVLPSGLKLKKSEEISSEKVLEGCTQEAETQTVKVDQVINLIQEMIQTEVTFLANLSLLEEAYGVFQKKRETFFDFIDEKKPDSKGVLRTGLKEKARLALCNLLENAVLLKPCSEVVLKVLKSSATIEIVAVTFAGLSYQSFETVGENYNKYTSFQRKLAKEEKKEFAKKINKLLSKEALKKSNLKFDDYAITLVQRPPRYELFLKELQKNISQPSPHIQTALETALKKIQKGTANMNEKVRYTVLFNLQDLKKLHGELSEGSSDKSESHSSAELSIGDRD